MEEGEGWVPGGQEGLVDLVEAGRAGPALDAEDREVREVVVRLVVDAFFATCSFLSLSVNLIGQDMEFRF